MKIPTFVSLVACSLAVSAFAAGPAAKDVTIIDHAKLSAAFEKGGPLLKNAQYRVEAGHRTGPGQVEIHDHDTDIFYITKGEATIITGGTAIDPKETAPGEHRADKSTGGKTQHLHEGDVIVIPTGVPHWMPEVSNPFDYLVIKVTTN